MIVYAGAIMVLFVFVVMMLNLGSSEARRRVAHPHDLGDPALLSLILLGFLAYGILGVTRWSACLR
uniref:NADH-quinone oxidoreductase subunit J family protein n=1 Tax=Aeromonas salmonicida TaxID=645 RepID=UPI00359C258E